VITRTTYWRDEQGGVRQVAVAALSALWDPLFERFQPLGPFDDPVQVEASLYEEVRAWYHLHGEQMDLGW
jgi:hypothetical protein